jgi:hypothetical protein
MTAKQQAFLRGMQKRAQECGLEKTAVVAGLVGGLGRMVLPHILAGQVTSKILPGLARNKWLANNFKRTSNVLNRTSNYINGNGAMNQAANLGLQFAVHPLAQIPVDYLANKIDGQGQPHTQPQVQG